MKQPLSATVTLNAPELLPCGAFISPRFKSARCQSCYGRRPCECAAGSWMPCEAGVHWSPNAQRSHSGGRVNRDFVDINYGRRGLGK